MGKHSDLEQHTTPNDSTNQPLLSKEKMPSPSLSAKKTTRRTLSLFILVLLALLISLVAAYTTFKMRHTEQQLITLQTKFSQLTQQVGKLQNGLTQSHQQLDKTSDNNQQLSLLLKQQGTQQNEFSTAIQQLDDQLNQQNSQVKQLQQQQLSSTQFGSPLQRLMQTEQLLQQANMQIWVYQAPNQAVPLLNKALQRLDTLHLSTLHPIIDAINSELKALQSVSPNALTESYTQLQQLLNLIPQLNIATSSVPNDASSPAMSDSINDWKNNFLASLKRFSQDFIQIKPRDPLAHCLQTATSAEQTQQCQLFRAISSPQQQQNLFNNLREQLVIATQSLIAHQPILFNSALKNAISWTQHYFDMTQPNTQQFLTQLQALQQANVFPDLTFPLSSSQKLGQLLDEQLGQITSPVSVSEGK